jgi:hypothetical protein
MQSSAWREQAFHGEKKNSVPELAAAAIFRILYAATKTLHDNIQERERSKNEIK